MESDVLVPFFQSLLTGLLAGLLAALGARLLLDWELSLATEAGALVGLLITMLVWLQRLQVFSQLLWRIESRAGLDLNADGVVGQPRALVVNPDAAAARARKVRFELEAGVTRRQLEDFLRQAYQVGTSESAMGIAPGRRGEYVAMRDLLMQLGIADWKNPLNPRAGWELVVPAEEAFNILHQHVIEHRGSVL